MDSWLEANRTAISIMTAVISIISAAVFGICVKVLIAGTMRNTKAMFGLFAEWREHLINATPRGLEERLAALEKIVMEDHLQRIERAARPPAESEGR